MTHHISSVSLHSPHLPNELSYLRNEPTYLPNEPPHLLSEPPHLTNELSYLPNEPPHLPNELSYLPNEPPHLPNELSYLPNEPTYLPNEPTHQLNMHDRSYCELESIYCCAVDSYPKLSAALIVEGSVMDPDPYSGAYWIRIPKTDPHIQKYGIKWRQNM